MRNLLSLRGEMAPLRYAVLAPALLLSQHLMVALLFRTSGTPLDADLAFWLLPLRRLAALPRLDDRIAALAFCLGLAVAWGLAMMSFRRAAHARNGYALAALAVVPLVQLPAIAILVALPRRAIAPDAEPPVGRNVAHIVQGLLAGMAIIVLAVLLSAVVFGSYGWGLFVMTPFFVGLTTAWIANRSATLTAGQTVNLVLAAAGLGTLALLILALEGVACILLATPLGAAAAATGGALGRSIALHGKRGDRPLLCVALLPAMFAIEAAMPPAIPIATEQAIDIAAPPATVWRALTSDAPIAAPPGMVSRAGLAYPIGGRLLGRGVGAARLGIFSTGVAHERVTAWVPGRRLSFAVLSQPPMMIETSPYSNLHTPHLSGYFDTIDTGFDLAPLPGGGTRLTVRTSHMLRIDPVLYWQPLARWVIHGNTDRVLRNIKMTAERGIP